LNQQKGAVDEEEEAEEFVSLVEGRSDEGKL
jgi:hypothetical protein